MQIHLKSTKNKKKLNLRRWASGRSGVQEGLPHQLGGLEEHCKLPKLPPVGLGALPQPQTHFGPNKILENASNFQLVNAAYNCPSSTDCMHWSLKQSQIQYQHHKMQQKD